MKYVMIFFILKVDLEIRKREFELVFKDMELEEEVKKKGYY